MNSTTDNCRKARTWALVQIEVNYALEGAQEQNRQRINELSAEIQRLSETLDMRYRQLDQLIKLQKELSLKHIEVIQLATAA